MQAFIRFLVLFVKKKWQFVNNYDKKSHFQGVLKGIWGISTQIQAFLPVSSEEFRGGHLLFPFHFQQLYMHNSILCCECQQIFTICNHFARG